MSGRRIGTWLWHPEARELRDGAGVVRLTALEAQLLDYLYARAGRTVRTDELLREVWGYAPGVRSRAVPHTVTRLRRKLGDDSERLVNVYGQGYRLDLPDEGDLIGRRALLQNLQDELDRHRRLALYGVGGVGKTRLARAVAKQRTHIWLDVAGTSNGDQLRARLGEALGLPPGARSAAEVHRALRDQRDTLVVIDAAETLDRNAHQSVARWLDSAAEVQILTTTRVLQWDEVGLAVPPLDDDAAARLFMVRAQAAQPRDTMASSDVQELVAAVGALPLAIELAAARLRVLALPDLLVHLRRDLAVLGGQGRGLVAVLEGAWARLSGVEQRALGVASCLGGHFRPDELCGAARLDPIESLEALDALVRSALVVGDRPDFRVLDVVRSFVASRVDDEVTADFVHWAVERGSRTVRRHADPTDSGRKGVAPPGWTVRICSRTHRQPG